MSAEVKEKLRRLSEEVLSMSKTNSTISNPRENARNNAVIDDMTKEYNRLYKVYKKASGMTTY